jgi:hypothetical protein
MKTILVVISSCLAVLTACVGSAVIQARQQAEANQRAAAELREQNQELSAQISTLAADKARLETTLQTQAAANKTLQEQLEQQRPEIQTAPEPVPPPKPFRVPTYLGRELLGDAWLVPRNFAQDPETGRVSYEPVILLDEKLRERFTARVYETNYVAQPVPVADTGNYIPPNNYYYPVYYAVDNGRRPDRPNRPPHRPPNQPPSRPTFPAVPGNNSPWGSVFVPPRFSPPPTPSIFVPPSASSISQQ